MKLHLLIALSLLVACGDEEIADTATPGDTGATTASRLSPQEFQDGIDAKRAEIASTARATGVRQIGTLAPDSRSSGARISQAPVGKKAAIDGVKAIAPTAPRLAPLPTEPTDEDLAVLIISTDNGADGVIDRVQRNYFDNQHRKVMLEEDRDGDGVFEKVEVYFNTFDEGRLTRLETDVDADGTIDRLEVRTYNDTGRALRVERDEDGDGAWDRVEHNTWDDAGRRTKWTVDNAPVDGRPEMVQQWGFGEDGRAQVRSLDRYTDGKLVNHTDYSHTFDENGRVLSMDVNGPTANNEISREYDDKGRLSAAYTDQGRDGTIDSATLYTYDDHGRMVRLAIDTGNDGKLDNVITRTYENWPEPRAGGCP